MDGTSQSPALFAHQREPPVTDAEALHNARNVLALISQEAGWILAGIKGDRGHVCEYRKGLQSARDRALQMCQQIDKRAEERRSEIATSE